MSLKIEIMISRLYPVVVLLMMAFTLNAQHRDVQDLNAQHRDVQDLDVQDQDVLISENFQDVALIKALEILEQNYPLQFFYEEKTLDSILINADFQEAPVSACLEAIL